MAAKTSGKKQTGGRPARVNIKVAAEAAGRKAEKSLSAVPGVRSVVQLFPEEPDEEMRAMYIADVDPDSLDETLERLREDPSVESVHETGTRKLIW